MPVPAGTNLYAQTSPGVFPSCLEQFSRSQITPCPSLCCSQLPQEVQEQQAAQLHVEKLQERLGQWQGHAPSAKSALLLPVTHCPSINLSVLLVLAALSQQRGQKSYV